jgi:hypothetical protein
MTPSEWANWVIAIFTIVLAIATIVYAVITAKMLSSSNKSQELLGKQITESQKQVEALKELSNAIWGVGPSVIAAQTQKEKREKMEEMRKKDNPQKRALTGR